MIFSIIYISDEEVLNLYLCGCVSVRLGNTAYIGSSLVFGTEPQFEHLDSVPEKN